MNHHGTLDSVLLNFTKTCDFLSRSFKYPSTLIFSLPFIYSWKRPLPFAFPSLDSHPPILAPSLPATFGPIPKTYPFFIWAHLPPAFFLLSSEHLLCCVQTLYLHLIHHSPSCPSFTAISSLTPDIPYSIIFIHGSLTLLGKKKFWLSHCPTLGVGTEPPPSPQFSQDVNIICLRSWL